MAQSKDSALGTYIQAVLGSSLKGHTGWLPKSVLIPPQCLSSVRNWTEKAKLCYCLKALEFSKSDLLISVFCLWSSCVWRGLYISERWACRRYWTRRDNMCFLSHNLSYVGSALQSLEREVAYSLGYTCVPAFSDYQREFVWGKCILYVMVYKDCSYPCPGSHVLQFRDVIHLSHGWLPHSVLLYSYRACHLPSQLYSGISPTASELLYYHPEITFFLRLHYLPRQR